MHSLSEVGSGWLLVVQRVSQSGRDNTMMSTFSDYLDGDEEDGDDDYIDDVNQYIVTI